MKIGTAALQDKIKEVLESPIVTTKQRGEPSTKRGGSGHRIYVSQDTRPRTGDKPVTLDGKYVAEHMGTALTLALAELAERRPKDPIEYLSMWLYKYRENMDYNMRVCLIIDFFIFLLESKACHCIRIKVKFCNCVLQTICLGVNIPQSS